MSNFNEDLYWVVDSAKRALITMILEIINPEGSEYTLSVLEWYVLRSLYEEDNQKASQLARTVNQPATSFTPILDKLAEKGLIARRPVPADRRSVHIYLTEKGEDRRQITEKEVSQLGKKIRVVWNAPELSALKVSIGKLVNR